MSGWFWVSLFLYISGNLWTRVLMDDDDWQWRQENPREYAKAKLVMSTIWPVLPFLIGRTKVNKE